MAVSKLYFELGTVVIAVLVVAFFSFFRSKRSRLPPGPRPWPVIGNLAHLGTQPHIALSKLSQTYGPLMFLKLGSIPAVVISSPGMAREIFKTQGDLFSGRRHTLGGEIMSYDNQSLGSGCSVPVMTQLRKICITELLSTKNVQQFKGVRTEEVLAIVKDILEEAKEGKSVQLNEKILETTNKIITRMLFTKSFGGLSTDSNGYPVDSIQKSAIDFQDLVEQTSAVHLEFFLGDFLPYLRGLDLTGIKPRMWKIKARWDLFLDRILQNHRMTKEGQGCKPLNDFVDMLISFRSKDGPKLTDDLIKGLLKDLISGGSESPANQSAWTLVELIRHPDIQKKLQEELDSVVGRERMVQESDFPNLPYLEAVVKESFRLHPLVPLLIPHESINSTPVEVAGYEIPPRTMLFTNVYAIQRDPSLWEDPLKFDPERFLNNIIDPKGQHYQLLPFGTGRRICPGITMGLALVKMLVSQLVHAFEWSLPDGTNLEVMDNMEIYRGLLLPKSISYKVTPKLSPSLYMTL